MANLPTIAGWLNHLPYLLLSISVTTAQLQESAEQVTLKKLFIVHIMREGIAENYMTNKHFTELEEYIVREGIATFYIILS